MKIVEHSCHKTLRHCLAVVSISPAAVLASVFFGAFGVGASDVPTAFPEFELSTFVSTVAATGPVRSVSAVSTLNVVILCSLPLSSSLKSSFLRPATSFPVRSRTDGAHQDQIHMDLDLCIGGLGGDFSLCIVRSGVWRAWVDG
jgi:hypothetical protein